METEEIFVDSPRTTRNSQNIFCKKQDKSERMKNKDRNINSLVTEKDTLNLFENNERYMEYFFSLREAVEVSRVNGGSCWCDPRDSEMRERLEAARWKPRVVVKLFGDEANLEECGFTSKQVALDEDGDRQAGGACVDVDTRSDDGEQDCLRKEEESFKCGLHGCKQRFSSLASYESHYHTCHNHVCATCKTSFVSNFLLDVHLQESHDSYFQILCPRLDMFRCLVESCELKFKTPDLRKDHLVSVHRLPANFMFHKPTKLKEQKSNRATRNASLTQASGDDGMSDDQELSLISQPSSPLSSSMEVESVSVPLPRLDSTSKKIGESVVGVSGRGKKIPHTVCFGRGSRRAFRTPQAAGRAQHWHHRGALDMDTAVDIEKVDFSDMIDSLHST